MVRQGDVLLVPIAAIPEGRSATPVDGRLIVAHGEATGHHHSVASRDAALVEAAEGVFLSIMAATPLEHPEHAAIWLEPGAYRVVTQREYAPQEIVRVRD
ncbi:MAG TPA: hypothetical protein VKK19_12950 [Candidatus Dormibacteraeota bacterium]|nr:hypothetical protein [Candidatus Dormibacteraeota bacterium]